MSNTPIIEAQGVSIRYITGDFKNIGLKEYVLRRLQGKYTVKNLPNGYTKVTLGDKNLYIINRNSSSSYTLQLTKETFDLFGK